MRKPVLLLFLCSILFSLHGTPVRAAEITLTPWLNEAITSCETTIQKLQAADLWIGGAVGLYDNGLTIEKAYGESTPGSGTPINNKYSFEIGSVSKSFTGVLLALATLEVPGLKASDPISKFFPEIKNTYISAITLQQLATHSAGLEDNPSDLSRVANFDPNNPLGNYSEDQLIHYLQSLTPVSTLIDRQHPGLYLRSYSNIGFAVLGLALTRIYNLNFEDLVTQKITGPLRMPHTFVNRKGTSLPPLMSKPFGVGKNPVSPMVLDIFAPAGAIVSTLPDMMKYLAANIEMSRDKLGMAMRISHQLGFGWDSLPGDQVIMKNGQTTGFSTFISFDPVTKRGAIELHNMYSILSNWVAALPLASLAAKTDQISKSYPQLAFDQTVNPVGIEIINSAAGTFHRTSGPDDVESVTLIAQEKNLILSLNGAVAGVVLATQGHPLPYWFFQGAMSLGTLSFTQDANGQVAGFTLNQTDGNGKPAGTYTFSK